MEFKFITKPYLLLLIVSAVLLITTFFPWWSANYDIAFGVGFNYSINGFHSGGILTFLMSLVGIACAFIESQKTRGLIAMGAGILAALGAIIALASLGGFGIGFGVIIALIASVALGLVGYMEYRKWKGLSTPSVFNKSTPPAQSTPSAQTPPPTSPSTPSAAPPPPPPPAPPKK